MVLQGIRRAAKTNGLTVVDLGSVGSLAQQVEQASLWPLSGVMSFVKGVQLQNPVIEILTAEHSGRPRVDVDHAAIVNAGFTHLRAKNPGSLSLLRTPHCRAEFSDAWQKRTQELTGSYGEFVITASTPTLANISHGERERFKDWLMHLARPAAVVCTTDAMATACIDYFNQLGMSVPDDATVLSCENSLIAEQIGITGIAGAYENAGYEAVELLSRVIQGQAVPAELTSVPGAEVQVRGSTDRLAALPEDIRVAQEFIRTNSCSGINVKDVMRTQSVSRVTFERRFKEFTGQTPGAEIRRIRIEKAEELLRQSNLSVTQVAAQCGFEGSSRFSLFFRKRTGLSPSEYRRRHTEQT